MYERFYKKHVPYAALYVTLYTFSEGRILNFKPKKSPFKGLLTLER
ncbi:hypothetical protein BMWSH_1206 [Priestia megaterium WSH-002]|uniref:Uncharacterized protein n=1 Tax=Priestia megaterium (strain WSH-002) TaxID=1006007 RepID=A0A8D3WWI0_PRIMW|nr:hypothetical protein BMWSH_1206 [Priestia megaterium WSH-002]